MESCVPAEMRLHSTRITAFSRSWNDADHRVLFLFQKKRGNIGSEAIITPENEKTMPAFLKNQGMHAPHS